VLAVALAHPGGQGAAPEPFASVWYRGVPPGTPRQDDLGAIRAAGFGAVTWPARDAVGLETLHLAARPLGLDVVEGREDPLLNPLNALRPSHVVTVSVAGAVAANATALAWRAIAHGARVVAFDYGDAAGAGLTDEAGFARPWVRPAAAVARQLRFNGGLIRELVPGPDVLIVPPRPAGLDIVLLQAPRSWVLIATNTSAEAARAVAELPAGLPAAVWIDLLDGSEMSMLNRPGGPHWTFDLPAGAARVYAIDKTGGS
jgi:hypothetical protein